MPCLLKAYRFKPDQVLLLTGNQESLRSVQPQPLLIRLSQDCVPVGVFTVLVVELMKDLYYKLFKKVPKYKNIVLFQVEKGFFLSLTERYCYIRIWLILAGRRGSNPQYMYTFTASKLLCNFLLIHESTKELKLTLSVYCPNSLSYRV